jgi:pseudaminic acid biosynthesis-associated methylase
MNATANAENNSEAKTAQTEVWSGDFGREYTDRNTLDVESLDQLYRKNYGRARSEINERILQGIPKNESLLEVGCNTGNQLLMLQHMSWSNLAGIELQPYAAEIARGRLPNISVKLGSALALPAEDSSFDLVFTSGVLIHIAPQNLSRALEEIHRTSRGYIWGLEYYAPEETEVTYRARKGLLWKMNFAQRYLERFNDLELVREERLPYVESENVDTVFLLRKKHSPLRF